MRRTVWSTPEVDGVVKTLGDPDEKPEQGQAFLVITGDDGLYVKGTISELLLDDVKMGTVVTANHGRAA